MCRKMAKHLTFPSDPPCLGAKWPLWCGSQRPCQLVPINTVPKVIQLLHEEEGGRSTCAYSDMKKKFPKVVPKGETAKQNRTLTCSGHFCLCWHRTRCSQTLNRFVAFFPRRVGSQENPVPLGCISILLIFKPPLGIRKTHNNNYLLKIVQKNNH